MITLRVAARQMITALAGLLVLAALVAPHEVSHLTPGSFVRIPIEGILGVALLVVLPERPRWVVAPLAGVALGLLSVLAILDIGFGTALARPFDPVLDWVLFDDALMLLGDSIGRAAAVACAIGAALLAIGLIVLMTCSTRHLSRLALRHRAASTRAVAVLAPAWLVCAMLGVQLVPGVPIAAGDAATSAYDKVHQVSAAIGDREAFAAELALDAFRDTPDSEVLPALRGRDVVLTFVESYGRDAVEDPEFAPQLGALLEAGDRRLATAGFSARSAFLTSPTAGGGSWLAHATFLSGLWIDTEQRHRTLVASDRQTLTSAFRRASWRTVAVMPGTTGDWSESAFYGHDQVYDSRSLGYRGPDLGWATVPDQYTLSAFERAEHATPGHRPLLAEIALVSSHAPWPFIPPVIGWGEVGDGSVFGPLATDVEPRESIWTKELPQIRDAYRRSVEYSLSSLISYVETYGDDNLVLIFLGDHQPTPIITGDGASRDVPITIVARDPSVLDRLAGWGWHDGLKPEPQSPVWRMDAFRDRFLTAFGR